MSLRAYTHRRFEEISTHCATGGDSRESIGRSDDSRANARKGTFERFEQTGYFGKPPSGA
jgi:hypothetical protein